MRDIPSSDGEQGNRSQHMRARILHRLYGMKWVSECSCHPSAGHPVEILDSTSMDTRPMRRR
jgi:hypothetical protein